MILGHLKFVIGLLCKWLEILISGPDDVIYITTRKSLREAILHQHMESMIRS